MTVTAVIYGLQAHELMPDEKAFFRDADPWGFILFARNIDRPRKVARLCGSLRDLTGRDVPIFIDQEGGRVQRLKPPTWRAAPAAGQFTTLWDREPELALQAIRLNHQLIGQELKNLGIDCDCLPVVDLLVDGADAIIGDRAFHSRPDAVAAMASEALAGINETGVAGVIKHIPGHGRAGVDSHLELPVVDTDEEVLTAMDFEAFRQMQDATMAMTAHVIYSAIDPEHCATHSREVIERIIRGTIGFDGLLMTDDLSMKALKGPMKARSEQALKAGCDLLLHCNGVLKEMIEVAHAATVLGGLAAERADKALKVRSNSLSLDVDETQARLKSCFDEAGLRAPAA